MTSTLENTVQKASFLQRIRNSLTTKLALLISVGTFAFASCGGESENCVSHADTRCQGGVVYWTDSCGDLENIKERCDNGCNQNNTGCQEPKDPDPYCGDGEINSQEECDGNNLNNQTCQSLGFDFGNLSCTNNCKLDISDCQHEEQPPDWPSITTKTVGGVPVKSGKTNQNGEILFTDEQTGELVPVTEKDKNSRNPLPQTGVTFIDGNGFEGFTSTKSNYISYFEVFPHNSGHEFNLVPEEYQDFTVFDYYFEQNPEKYNAMENYLDWANNSYVYKECMTKEELERDRELSMFVLSVFMGGTPVYKVVNAVADVITTLEELGVLSPPPIYQVFEPLNFTAPSIVEGGNFVPENCYDNIDNDCDGTIDSQDSDCTCTDSCDYTGQIECFGDGRKECGNHDDDICLEWGSLNECNSDEYCENGECLPSCVPTTEICDGIDNDCDGQIDEGWCSCINGEVQQCGTDVGTCEYGTQTCIDGDWENCVGATNPIGETCDGLDNDCDGNIDESLIQACYTACGQGLEWCIDETWQNCNAPRPSTEVCDSIDNDCDGNVDEGYLCNGSDCLEGICCSPQDHVTCEFDPEDILQGHDLYWVDGCGRISDEMAEDCPINTCVCESGNNGVTLCYCDDPQNSCYDPDRDGYGFNCELGSDCDNSNADIHPGADEILNGLDDNCNAQIDEGFVNTGNPQITLFWDNQTDLDLHVYAPNGCHLYYGDTDCGTGHLDRDARMDCQPEAEAPPENIYWEVDQAPAGLYVVEIDYYKECDGSGPTSYTLSVSHNQNVTTYTGTLNNEGNRITVTSFNH